MPSVNQMEHMSSASGKRLNTPVLADDGSIRLIIHRVEDVTAAMRLENEQREHDRTRHTLELESKRYQELIDRAPDAMVIVGAGGRDPPGEIVRPSSSSATAARSWWASPSSF